MFFVFRAVLTWLSKVIEELVWFWFYYALWLASVFTLFLVLRQSSENRSRYHLKICLRVPHYVWCNNCPIKSPNCFFLESPARSVGILWLQALAEGKSYGLINTVTCIVGSTVAISICIRSVNIVMGWWILAQSNNLQSIIMNTYTIQCLLTNS